MKEEDVAKICHQANKAYCESLGNYSHNDWDKSPDWQKKSAIRGVNFHHDHPIAPISCAHEEWMREKIETGWKYGPIKNLDKKEHPCMISFHKLSPEQQMKYYLFRNIVHAINALDFWD